MSNTIEAAEIIEKNNFELKRLLEAHKKIAETLNDGSLDALIQHTQLTINLNETAIKLIRDTAEDGS